ncbi:hypothetical protein P7H50_11665 [Enterococcus durans]|uniref:hypothetical protein n=1 Tax=Enterococcus durans TaxID=53345 RepID=UPI00288F2FB1|nr:hypothetical protein [Enterococcus durans]MDT2837522.1 hypothetical protein [Enterococcus durans]
MKSNYLDLIQKIAKHKSDDDEELKVLRMVYREIKSPDFDVSGKDRVSWTKLRSYYVIFVDRSWLTNSRYFNVPFDVCISGLKNYLKSLEGDNGYGG